MRVQLCGGGAGKARHQHRASVVLIDGPTDLVRKVRGLTRARRTEDSVFARNRMIRPAKVVKIRRAAINRILCHGVLHKSEIEQEFGIEFDRTFAPELARLAPFVEDGLLDMDGDVIQTSLLGRIFIRNIAMIFDPYLEKQKLDSKPLFSKTL